MNAVAIITTVVLLLVLLTLFLRYQQRARVAWGETDDIPPDLRNARLWASEESFRCSNPAPLRGRVDQVYEREDGGLVITDTKNRSHYTVYESDRVQLSLYRALISHRPWAWLRRQTIADYGYIRLVSQRGSVYQWVNLLPEARVVELYERYLDVRSGIAKPRCAVNQGLCRGCAYRNDCPHTGNR